MTEIVRNSELSILIPSFQEEIHILRAVQSAKRLTPHVFVLDSNSKDDTSRIAQEAGAQVITREFPRFADKLNWGADHIEYPTPWVLRLDADEILTDDLISRLPAILASADQAVTGFYLRRQLWFLGRWVRFGGMYPTYSLRVWRTGKAYCESRDLDEHMIPKEGRFETLNLDLIDDPLTSLSVWIQKHNGYSGLEAAASLRGPDSEALIRPSLFGSRPQQVRWVKEQVFYRLPPFIRPVLYFVYRFIFRLGFLDGTSGSLFHFLHGLWYRVLVDAKIMEIRLKNLR